MKPWREWIHQFHWCIMMWVILDQWSWSRSPKETRSYCQCWFVLQVRNVTGETADVLLEYIQRNIPEGVSMSVEQTELESLSQLFELPPQAQEYLNQNIKWKKSKKNNYRKDKSLHSQKAVWFSQFVMPETACVMYKMHRVWSLVSAALLREYFLVFGIFDHRLDLCVCYLTDSLRDTIWKITLK